jgi:hypothetical protein
VVPRIPERRKNNLEMVQSSLAPALEVVVAVGVEAVPAQPAVPMPEGLAPNGKWSESTCTAKELEEQTGFNLSGSKLAVCIIIDRGLLGRGGRTASDPDAGDDMLVC